MSLSGLLSPTRCTAFWKLRFSLRNDKRLFSFPHIFRIESVYQATLAIAYMSFPEYIRYVVRIFESVGMDDTVTRPKGSSGMYLRNLFNCL